MRKKTTGPIPMKFMGRKFPTLEAFRQAFPAYGSDDAIRAIRSGCGTVMEVEDYLWRRKNRQYLQLREAAQRSPFAARYALGER